MNPDRIWRESGPSAYVDQLSASEYTVFVAMPFRDQFSYRSEDVFSKIITTAVRKANDSNPKRPFSATPVRADKLSPNAREITEEIVEHILRDHFFIADLTLANQGVLIEVGIALSLKPPKHVVLICQGALDLHFDIKDNRVIPYDSAERGVEEIARALLDASKAFEDSTGIRLEKLRESLSPSAVYLLNLYGRLRLQNPTNALHVGRIREDSNLSKNHLVREIIFAQGISLLLERGLMKLAYEIADDGVNPDRYGLHATDLGLLFIRRTWPKSFKDLK